MNGISKKENLVFSIGGLILIALIFSGWKGMLAAGLVLAWLLLASKLDGSAQKEESVSVKENGFAEERRAGQVVSFENHRHPEIRRRRAS